MKTRYFMNPVEDDMQRALRVINHTYEAMSRTVHLSTEQGKYNIWVDDNVSGEIVSEFPEMSKNEAAMLLAGMFNAVKVITYEGF